MALGTASEKPTILIVEDDDAVRHSLRMVLEVYGFAVEAFDNGDDLITRGGMDDGCVIILDVDLPGANGLEILTRLRDMGVPVPVVLVTGRITLEMHRRAQQLDALGFLDKPIDIERLLDAIGSVAC